MENETKWREYDAAASRARLWRYALRDLRGILDREGDTDVLLSDWLELAERAESLVESGEGNRAEALTEQAT